MALEDQKMTSTVDQATTADRLQTVSEFRSCTRSQLEEVAQLAERVDVGFGEVLIKEGRISREFFLILSGTVVVTRKGVTINTLGPGQFFGELAAVDPAPRTATVTATSDLEVLIIGPREFATMRDIPGIRDSLLRSMAKRLRSADDDLAAAHDHTNDRSTGLSSTQ